MEIQDFSKSFRQDFGYRADGARSGGRGWSDLGASYRTHPSIASDTSSGRRELPDSVGSDFEYSLFDSSSHNSGAGRSRMGDSVATVGAAGSASKDALPCIMLHGLHRSGKSSIEKVVFHKMSPNETLFLESTTQVEKNVVCNNSFVRFQIWDLPGQSDQSGADDEGFAACDSLVFVIDSQDEYVEALAKLHSTVVKAYEVNPKINFEVFIHKIDGLSDDHKLEAHRDINSRAMEDLYHQGLDSVKINFHGTSIYDHSVFEAFSKVVQSINPQLGVLQNLLNVLNLSSNIEKSFLFDVISKIYIATDASPVNEWYELCSDMIDVVVDVSCIYGVKEGVSDGSAYNTKSSSMIKLSNGMVLYMREVSNYLALVCLMRDENDMKQGLLDYNFECFRKAIEGMLEVQDVRR